MLELTLWMVCSLDPEDGVEVLITGLTMDCPSAVPSLEPSFAPSLVPSSSPSTAPSASPTTSPSAFPLPSTFPSIAPSRFPSTPPTLAGGEFGNCTAESRLETTMEGGTGGFGSMFTVRTGADPVTVTSIEFLAASTDVLYVQVFTKQGNYKGSEANVTAWHKVVDTWLRGAGDVASTDIPENQFDPVHMLPNQTRAFYVSLSKPVMQYSRTARKIGQAISSDSFLQIDIGAGLAGPAFGESLVVPRVFNGALRFRHPDDCITILTTTVTYNFLIVHATTLTPSRAVELTTQSVESTLDSIIQSNGDFRDYVRDYGFELESISSKEVAQNSSGEPTIDCLSNLILSFVLL